MSDRNEKIRDRIQGLSAQFIEREANNQSLITVTRTEITPDGKRATVFVSVMPEEKEKAAIDFLKRLRTDLRHFIQKNMNIRSIPFLEIEIDKGEKNRQRIDELLRE